MSSRGVKKKLHKAGFKNTKEMEQKTANLNFMSYMKLYQYNEKNPTIQAASTAS